MPDQIKRKLMNKVSERFRKKLKGRMIFKVEDYKIGIEYMYGGRWHVMIKRKKEKARTINMLATLEQVADILIEEKYKNENKLLHTIKSRL